MSKREFPCLYLHLQLVGRDLHFLLRRRRTPAASRVRRLPLLARPSPSKTETYLRSRFHLIWQCLSHHFLSIVCYNKLVSVDVAGPPCCCSKYGAITRSTNTATKGDLCSRNSTGRFLKDFLELKKNCCVHILLQSETLFDLVSFNFPFHLVIKSPPGYIFYFISLMEAVKDTTTSKNRSER